MSEEEELELAWRKAKKDLDEFLDKSQDDPKILARLTAAAQDARDDLLKRFGFRPPIRVATRKTR